MKKFCLLIIALALGLSGFIAEEKPQAYEAQLTTLLQAVVTADGLVHYDKLAGPLSAEFAAVLNAVETFDVATLQNDAQKMAFWINAYNVLMLKNIVDHPNAKDIIAENLADTFFKTPRTVGQTEASLDQIEHVILRRQAGPAHLQALRVAKLDPRLHVGLNCAAISCPRIPNKALTAQNLNRELDRALAAFANDPMRNRAEGDTVILSSLIEWFADDFDATGVPAGDFLLANMDTNRPGYATLKATLAGQSATALASSANVKFEYKWLINRAG